MVKSKLVLLFFVAIINQSFSQDFPVDLSIVKIPKPEQVMFEENIDFSNVKSVIVLISRDPTIQVFDTLYIKYYNAKGLLEKKINFSNNQRWNMTNNTYVENQLTKTVHHNLVNDIKTELIFSYDSSDQLINFNSKKFSLKDNKVLEDADNSLTYDTGKLIRTSKTITHSALSGDYWTTYKYQDSLLIETTEYNGKTTIKTHSKNIYDKYGKIILRKGYIESDYYKEPHLTSSTFYQYNSGGLLVSDSLVLHDSEMTKVASFKYDPIGRIAQMTEHINKKGTENYLTSDFKYENEKLISINSIRVKNLDYITWRIPICKKPDKQSLGKPKSANIVYTYDEKNSRIGTEYTLENYPTCRRWKNVVEYRN